MTEIEKQEIEIMAEIIKGIYPDWQEMSAEQLAKHLCENNIRHEAEVRAETAKEFAEKFLEYIKRVNYFAIVNWGKKDYKMNVSDISEVLNAVSKEYGIDLAEQFGKED